MGRTIGILTFFALAAAVSLTVYVAQQRQEIRQRAAEPQSYPSSDCSPPYSGYLGCLTENGCNNIGISSQVSCSDENVQQGVYCYESAKQGQSCAVNEGSGICDNQGNCVLLAGSIPSLIPTETPSQEETNLPTESPLTPTSIPTPTLTSTPDTLFDCSGVKLGYGYQCFSGSCQSPYAYSGYNNSGTSCDNNNQICCVNYNVSTATPSKIPTLIPTAVPTSIPTIASTQVTSPVPTTLTPSPVPFCYLKNKGDGNCDNIINISDYELWRTEFVGTLRGIPIINKPSDFNKDGDITIADFNIWKTSMADTTLPH